MLTLLWLGVVRLEHVQYAATLLLHRLNLIFIPLCVTRGVTDRLSSEGVSDSPPHRREAKLQRP